MRTMYSFKKILGLLCLLTLCFSTQAQNSNIEVVGQLDYNSDLNDIWGYVAPDGTEYALIGMVTGTAIVSLEDPANPRNVAMVVGGYSTWRDIKVNGDFAYVVDDQASDGLLIIDLSNLPESIEYAYWYGNESIEITQSHNIFIDEHGYAYLFGGNYGNGGTIILDLNEDPWNPEIVGNYNNRYVHDGFVRNDTLWTSEFNDGLLSVYDVSNKSQIQPIGNAATPGSASHNCWLSDDGHTIFTTDEVDGGFVTAYDCSNISDIREIARYRSNPEQKPAPHNTFVKGDYLFTSYYKDGLIVHDITRPESMTVVASYDTSPMAGGGFEGAWGVYPYLPSGHILVSDIQEGLIVLAVDYQPASFLDLTVIDADLGIPLANADVSIAEESLSTDLVGKLSHGFAREGQFDIEVKVPGYETVMQTISLTAGQSSQLEIEMTSTCGNSICDVDFAEDYCLCNEDCNCSLDMTFLNYDELTREFVPSANPVLLCPNSEAFGGLVNSADAVGYVPFEFDGLSCIEEFQFNADHGPVALMTPSGQLLAPEGAQLLYSLPNYALVLKVTESLIADSEGTNFISVANDESGCLGMLELSYEELLGAENLSTLCPETQCDDDICEPSESFCDCESDCPCTIPITFERPFLGNSMTNLSEPWIVCSYSLIYDVDTDFLNPGVPAWYTFVGPRFLENPCVGSYDIEVEGARAYGLSDSEQPYILSSLPTSHEGEKGETILLEIKQSNIDAGPVKITITSDEGCYGYFEYDFSQVIGSDNIAYYCPMQVECDDYTNESCPQATALALGQNGLFSNVCFGNDPGNPDPESLTCFDDIGQQEGAVSSSAWFSFTASETDHYTFTVTNDPDSKYPQLRNSQMAIFSGSCDALELVPDACNDDIDLLNENWLSQISHFPAQAGQQYYILVDGWRTARGTFGINVSPSEALASAELSDIKMEVFPNPTQDNWLVSVETLENSELQVELRDMSGRLLYQKQLIGNSLKIDASSFASGTYLLNMSNSTTSITRKLIKI